MAQTVIHRLASEVLPQIADKVSAEKYEAQYSGAFNGVSVEIKVKKGVVMYLQLDRYDNVENLEIVKMDTDTDYANIACALANEINKTDFPPYCNPVTGEYEAYDERAYLMFNCRPGIDW